MNIYLNKGEFSNGLDLDLILKDLEREWKKDYALRSLLKMKKQNEIDGVNFQTLIKGLKSIRLNQIYELCRDYNRKLRFNY